MSEEKNTASFTPGPWRVDSVRPFGAYGVWTEYATHSGDNGAGYPSQICSVFTVSFKQIDKATHSERGANAMLIAAAPDLLEALKNLIYRSSVETLDKAIAAVAKATGG